MVPVSRRHRRSRHCRWCLPLLLGALLANQSAEAAEGGSPPCGMPHIGGTFYQPLARHAEWNGQRWADLSAALAELGMREIFVQWTMADGLAFFPTATRPVVANSPLDRVFAIAAERDLRVWAGLELDQVFLPALEGALPLLNAHLRAREQRLAAVLPDLAAYLRRQPVLAGWYISAELYDGAWAEGPAAEAVAAHLARVSGMLKAQIDVPVAISTFANGEMAPADFADLWRDLIRRGGIDLLLFQDGVGAGKLSPAESGRYAAALEGAVHGEGREFGVIVEQFHASDGGFGPAPMARVHQQLAAIAALADTRRLAFTLPDYILPESGEPTLLLGYRKAMAACR